MHELSFVRKALKKIKELDKDEITIKIPENHDVEEFREILNSLLGDKKIKIRIEKVPIKIRCLECGYEGKVKIPLSMVKVKVRCPECRSSRTETIQGRDIEVV